MKSKTVKKKIVSQYTEKGTNEILQTYYLLGT